ncbi:hypothetical protein ACIBUY_28590 [Streptomyces sp. NPDC050085]|uniref:hypothetical protein n=1 Tax=Streptomyces sp. NPDC050085 TaxID=3365600 RepID=UPI0037B36EEA
MLYKDDAGNGHLARWTAGHRLSPGLVTWPLSTTAVGWTADKPVPALRPHTRYGLGGGTKDNSWSSSNVTFTLADTERLTPGQVAYDKVTDSGEESLTTVSVTEFEKAACDD